MPIRRYKIIIFSIAFRHAAALFCRLRIVRIDAAVILHLGPSEGAYSPDTQPLPVHAARKPFERSLSHLADVPVVVVRVLDWLNEIQFRFSCAGGDIGRADPQLFEPLISPGHKEKVPRPCHDGARAGEKQVRESVTHRSNTKFVARIVLPESINDIEHSPSFTFRVIQPDEC